MQCTIGQSASVSASVNLIGNVLRYSANYQTTDFSNPKLAAEEVKAANNQLTLELRGAKPMTDLQGKPYTIRQLFVTDSQNKVIVNGVQLNCFGSTGS